MKYKYNISNLDCANCAAKIEDALNKDKNIINARVNFSSLKLSIETNLDGDVLKYVSKIVSKIEPDVVIYESEVKEENILNDIIRLSIGILIGLLVLFLPFNMINKILLVIAYVILLSKTFVKAIKLLIKDKTLNENFLITISCIGAYLIDKQSEGLMVIILYEIGKILEAKAVNNSRKSISKLMNIRPMFANVLRNNKLEIVNPEDVKINDVIVVKTGEKVPLDGVVVKGEAKLNTSALTGESVLKNCNISDTVLSGMINVEGLIEVKTTSTYEDSTVNKILELVENATDKKAKTETFVSKAARVYTPLVFILAILLILFGCIFTNDSFNEWFYRALVFLVISCPCAIAISVPLSYFAGIGKCSKEGILVKGSNYLDNLRNIKRIIFDKTGTITTGKFEDIKIDILDKKYKEKDVLEIIVKGEMLSNHPIAKSVVDLISIEVDNSDVKDFKEYKGKGISYTIDNKKVLVGNYKFCNADADNGFLYVNIDDVVVASIGITDKIKDDALKSITELKKNNIICEMFTGDSKTNAMSVANSVGIDSVKYELLPNDKYNLLENYINEKSLVTAFVGDGINDTPTLALADIGISMGGIGSSYAIEASDVVIMTDELNKINKAINISKYTNKIIKQNLIFAIGTKVLILILSAIGVASMWQAVFADVGVTLITILNTTRILKK